MRSDERDLLARQLGGAALPIAADQVDDELQRFLAAIKTVQDEFTDLHNQLDDDAPVEMSAMLKVHYA